MPRRGNVVKREVSPDPVYGSKLVTALIHKIMRDGKKSLAERIVYEALDIIGAKTNKEPLDVLEQAIKNVILPRGQAAWVAPPSSCGGPGGGWHRAPLARAVFRERGEDDGGVARP